ncbi:hypothetical protein Poli38472_002173 [Pythium oligandrum]|uniref:Choline transporter-like protein n=1 Tax=Pythium oligandrum TaxID=41045 RepID=A0A8K1CH19_PYTOL|nr:hypothetical protein Poli38472_002173 [Pythium oligandrum]|eukprot:TMW63232.1 hypothetical protein Poli38472_002173 [Pythium oligandrum]
MILAETCLDPPDADPACTLARYNQKECSVVCKTKRVQKSVWEVEETTPNPMLEQLQGHLQLLGRFVSDTKAAVGLILLVGGAGAMVLGVLWLVILQFFAGCMIWLTCMLVVLILVLMSLFCSVRSGIINSEALEGLAFLNGMNTSGAIDLNSNALQAIDNASDRLQFKAAAYVLWVLTGIFLLLLLAMRKRIHIAIAIIRESSRAIKTLPLLLLWPVVPTIAFVLLVMYAVTIAAYIMSSADISSVLESTAALATASTGSTSSSVAAINGTLSEIPSDKIQQVLLVYHLFGFLWTNQFFHAISICTIAGSVAQYYWTPPDGNNRRKLEARFPIARALRNVFRFSLGSLCFGSFIIALVQLLRILLEYVDHQTKELQQGNRFVKVAFLPVRCCLWCFEKCLKFLSKNAYIFIAMRGNSFCSASVASFKLLFKNIARVAVVNSISFFLLLLVKTTITLTVAGVVFVALSNASASSQLKVLGAEPVTSPMAPVLVASILSWLIASAFMNIYDAAIDTILLCFCEDTELHGEGSSEFMSPELRRIMGDTGSKPKVVHVGLATSVTKSGSGGGGEPGGNKVHVDNDEI